MKKLRLIFFLVAVFCSLPGFSQADFSSLTLVLTDMDKQPVSGESYTLLQGKDSVTTRITNGNGEFRIDSLLLETEYALVNNSTNNSCNSEVLKLMTEPFLQDYILNIALWSCRIERSALGVYFEKNQVEPIENHEAQFIADLLKEHPTLCLEFSQSIGYDESEGILKQRKENFLKLLEETGIDMSHIRYSDQVHKLPESLDDLRSRIQGAVYSMDSKCN